VQRINVAYVTNINVQIIENYHADQAVYVNRSAPRGVTVVPRDVFVQSRPAGRAALPVTQTEVTRAPFMGMTAKVAPQRESIIAKPPAARAPVPQPPPAMLTRRVYSRTAPPPAQVPFAQQQKALVASPGRPVAPEALARIQGSQKPAPAQVTVVNRAALVKQVPPVLKTAPPAVPPARVSPGQQPVVKQAPDVKQKPEPPAPVAMKPAVKQAPDGQQKPAPAAPANPQRAPAPGPIVTAKPNVPAQPPAKQPAVMTRGGPEGASASTLITTLKTQTLPDADRRLAEARKVAGIKLDFNAVAQRLAAAKTALGGAEKDLAAGNGQQALQKATAIKQQVDDEMSQVSAAMQAASQAVKQGPQKH
jgi:hypothetical protein